MTDVELPPLFDTGDELRDQEESGYVVDRFIARGGTGEVYKLTSKVHGGSRIAKVFLPFYYLGQMSKMGLSGASGEADLTHQVFNHFESLRISDSEYRTLATLDHPFIVSVHDHLRLDLTEKAQSLLFQEFGLEKGKRTVFAIIADYVDGIPLLEFTRSADPSDVYQALRGVSQAIDHLNLNRRVLHCDIKSQNVLIRTADSLPVLVDFGLAQSADDVGERKIAVATELLPPVVRGHALAQELRDRLLRNELVDRTEFMQAFFPWLDRYQFGLLLEKAADTAQLPDSERQYLRALSGQLTDTEWLRKHGSAPIAELVSRIDANRVYPIVRTGARREDVQIPAPNFPVTVSRRLEDLALHPALVRLNRQNQLGLLPARFPGARHSRYLHSLDAYRLARSFARSLLDQATFRLHMSEDDVVRFLVAALYHDVNHLPFLHIFQELADRSWLPDPYELAVGYGGPDAPVLNDLLKDVDLNLADLRSIIKPPQSTQPDRGPESIIRSMLDSGIDVDKLSYLQLDSLHSGLGFADSLDLGALFQAARVERLNAGVTGWTKGSLVVCFEPIIRARTIAFEKLYWCSENRAMMAAFTELVRKIVSTPRGLSRLKDLLSGSVGGSDHGFLVGVDQLASDLKVSGVSVSSFFDGAWGSLKLVAQFKDERTVSGWSKLRPKPALEFEERVKSILAEKLNVDPTSILLDIPGRRLDLGGPVFVRVSDGGAMDWSEDERFRQYRQRLTDLSNQISVFAVNVSPERLAATEDERVERVKTAISDAKSADPKNQDLWN
jgi:serine/threonine protein kinase